MLHPNKYKSVLIKLGLICISTFLHSLIMTCFTFTVFCNLLFAEFTLTLNIVNPTIVEHMLIWILIVIIGSSKVTVKY